MISDNIIPGYQISSILYEGPHTIVYRALRTVDAKKVLLKTVLNPYPSSTEVAYLIKEYELLASLDIPGISKVYERINVDNRPFLVIDDFDGISLAEYAATIELPLEKFLEIASRISDILGRLHAAGITHKNINPTKIIINKETEEIRLVDFKISAKLSLERTAARNPNTFEGTLQYISPEQTGRMNRSTDYRTDLYSLGITFYELLIGSLPFQSDEPMELIYNHIAKNITPPTDINPKIPKVVSDIIVKLTAKNAEDRYQSALGLTYDLEQCLTYLREKGTIPYFPIGQNDIYSKFNILEKLYGREKEIETLMHLFDTVAKGDCKLVLISGSSGLGKTALINEIHKPTAQKNGYFISGKFDQFKSNIPFNAFSLAFSQLVNDLVSEPASKLEKLKAELTDILGLNAPLLVELIPKFEYIIGKQGPVQKLNPSESQNRFFFTLREFIRVLATKEHPLTIFLDDLQWSDDSSLRLIIDLISKEIPYLLIIGAYRDNEISEGHPLSLAIDEINRVTLVKSIKLSALEATHVNQLIADTLKTKPADTQALAGILYRRTAGNPFYVYELLKTIFGQGLIKFDYSTNKWTWDITKIEELDISTNVIDFLSIKLKELPEDCQKLLGIAACIGNRFDLKTLIQITGKNAHQIASILWFAIEEEIIVPLSDEYRLVTDDDDFGVIYKFHHDRIQQTAYLSLDEDERKRLHLQIGRVLLQNSSDIETNERLIELVGHFNEGRELISDPAEKEELAKMNLWAGKKAQLAVAYHSALTYFVAGLDLLPESRWQTYYRLTFDLYVGYAQNAYQTNDYTTAENCTNLLLEKAETKLEKVEILSIRVRQYNTVGKPEEAIRFGIEGLALLGYALPEKPGQLLVLKEVAVAKLNLGRRKPTDLLNSPVLQDPEKKAVARLLTEIGPSAYVLGNDNLYGLTQLKIVNLSISYGNCEESAYAYVAFGAVLSSAFGDLKSAQSFGKLGLALNEKFGDIEYRCRVIAAYGVLTYHFNNHWNTSSQWFKKGIEAGYISGDLFYLGHCAVNCTIWNPALDLATSLSDQKKYFNVVVDTNYTDAVDTARMNMQLTKNLMGLTDNQLSMNDSEFDEVSCLAQMTERKYSSGIGMYYIHKAQIFAFYEDYANAYESVKQADKYVSSLVSLINLTRLCCISFFTCSGYWLYGNNPPKDQLKKRMEKELSQMKKWAVYNPTNFQHLQYLMEAELANVKGDFATATGLYEKAIKSASQHEWPADEAYANELAAKFYYRNGYNTASSGYWKAAYYLFDKWGAAGKTKLIEDKYAHFVNDVKKITQNRLTDLASDEGREIAHVLDVDTVVKSSQAISGEIELKALLGKMMHIIMMNAGAEKGTLLLEQRGELIIQATAVGDEISTMQNMHLRESDFVSPTIINYVSNLHESVVLMDAAREGQFKNDEYVIENQTKSILCSPILFLNKLYGIIYLENTISVGAFTEERLKLVQLLSSQMAISIQNAILYSNLEDKVQERTLEIQTQRDHTEKALIELKATQAQLIQKEKMASLGELTAGIAHEIQNPLNFVNNFSDLSAELINELQEEQQRPDPDTALEIELTSYLKDNVSKILLHGQRAANIVKGMLEHARTSKGELQSTDLNALADEVLHLTYQGLKAKEKTFDCELVTQFEPEIVHLNVVPQEISRVVVNLLNNAFYAVRERQKNSAGKTYIPTVTVTTKALPGRADGLGRGAQILVSDNGTGMPESVKQKIFQPFFTTKPTGEGTGLGLSLSFDIITKGYGGSLLVESQEGEGTTFTIQLPMVVGEGVVG